MLNQIAEECHKTSASKGFWDGERDPSQVWMLIVSEAVEAMEEHRDGRSLNESLYEDSNGLWSTHRSERFSKPVGVPSEMIDILIRVFDACAAWGIDIDKALAEKMAYNATRPIKHGRTF